MQIMPIQNALGMKPYQTRTMFADRFGTVADLQMAIEKAVLICGQDPEYINVDFRTTDPKIVSSLELEAECLSDGSIVYNLILVP